MAVGVLGVLLTAVALVLHYSGVEAVDLSYADDKCFSGTAVQIYGLPVDACLTREAPNQGTDCGEPAANAFCVTQGANYFVNFTLDDVMSKRGSITLGNKFIGGHLGFSEVCCDVGKYEPAWSRVLFLVGGTALLFVTAAVAARLMLTIMEGSAEWLRLEAGEVLYFLLGVEDPLKWVLFSSALMYWIDFTLWVVWCGKGVDCESHGSDVRATVYNLGKVLLMFSCAAFVAKATPRIVSVRYLYAGQFARVRAAMRNESLLSALTQPEVRDIVMSRQQQVAMGPAGGGGRAPTATAGDGHAHHGHKHMARSAGGRGMDLQGMLEATGYGSGGGGAVSRFRRFLNHYSHASEDDLAAEAAAEGAILFDVLVGAWDVNLDGSVGLHDFEELFKQVKPPPGFKNANEAAQHAWRLFDLDMDGHLGRDEVIKALAMIYNDRANTARTVLSNESAVSSLEAAIGFVLYTLLLFAASSLLGFSAGGESQSSLDFFTTYVLALSFIFGDTVRSVFRSTLYLFVEQPYAVGDYLELDDELWCVESFDLVYTQLRKWEYNQYAKVPNDMLIDSKLVNVSRGGAFKDTIPLSAPITMPVAAIKEIKERMLAAGAERPRDIVPDSPHIKIDTIDSGQVMQLMLEWVYAFPPGDRQRVDDCREYMVACCRDALVEAGISDQNLRLDFRLAASKAVTGKK